MGGVTSRSYVEDALIAIVAQTGGKIDIFLSNGGILAKEAAVLDYPESEIRRSFETNLMGSCNALRAFTPLAAPGAKFLCIGSSIGHWSTMVEVPIVELRSRKGSGVEDGRLLCFREPKYSLRKHPSRHRRDGEQSKYLCWAGHRYAIFRP
jgi:NAD(P)-dependent dehydrogenase (short-subunit alcohol dehydrogenase family)